MQTDKDLFDLIKKSYPLNPRADFILDTEMKLKLAARKLNRRRIFKRFSLATSGFLLCALAISWFFFLNGKEEISNTLSSLDDRNSASYVKDQNPLIYIYNTHNWESFLPEINETEPSLAVDDTKNIKLVGDRLSKKLKEKNIENIHDNKDITKILQNERLNAYDAYSVTRTHLKDALKKNKSIKMALDLHRDSLTRPKTTIKIKGKDYARIVFVVLDSNKNYKENLDFAKQLHKTMEKIYPGLSRGVVSKPSGQKSSNYNQDLLTDSTLIEIGGVENTLKEEYRSADALAEVIAEIIKKQKNN